MAMAMSVGKWNAAASLRLKSEASTVHWCRSPETDAGPVVSECLTTESEGARGSLSVRSRRLSEPVTVVRTPQAEEVHGSQSVRSRRGSEPVIRLGIISTRLAPGSLQYHSPSTTQSLAATRLTFASERPATGSAKTSPAARSFNVAQALTVRALIIKGVSRENIAKSWLVPEAIDRSWDFLEKRSSQLSEEYYLRDFHGDQGALQQRIARKFRLVHGLHQSHLNHSIDSGKLFEQQAVSKSANGSHPVWWERPRPVALWHKARLSQPLCYQSPVVLTKSS